MLMISTKPGFTVDSSSPKRKRFAAVPAKFVHAGVVMRITPQPIVQYPRNFAMGRRWSR